MNKFDKSSVLLSGESRSEFSNNSSSDEFGSEESDRQMDVVVS